MVYCPSIHLIIDYIVPSSLLSSLLLYWLHWSEINQLREAIPSHTQQVCTDNYIYVWLEL